jgi:hypothetical protein
MSRVARLARYLWAAPASLVGLVLAPFFDRRRIENGILLCEGARWPRRLGWRFSAITFGHVVLSTVPADEDLMEHEAVHVGQYERWGVFLLPAYLVASIWVRLRGRRAYWDNPFEKAARRTR